MQVNTGSGWPLEMGSFNVEVRSYENDNKNMKKYLGTDHLTCRVGVMVFCFVQKKNFGQHESKNIFFLSS